MDFALASHDEILRELGLRLRAQRLAQSLSQKELAGMAGVAIGTVKTLEQTGVSSLETLVRAVLALNLTDHLQPLFALQQQSIAQMAEAEKAKRKRAPRSKPK